MSLHLQASSSSSSSTSIPIIDLEALTLEGMKTFELEKLHTACRHWGIFQLKNHGITSSSMKKLNDAIKDFYGLPSEEKMRYAPLEGTAEGYAQSVVYREKEENTDYVEKLFMVTFPLQRRQPHILSKLPASFRESLEAYLLEVQRLSKILLRSIAESLNIHGNVIEKMFEEGMQLMRMNHYPPCPKPELVTGFKPHTDGCGITLVHQVEGGDGLHVKKDGVWIPVQFLPNSFVVNLGDIIEIWSNGLYKSAEHKVTVDENERRMSIAVFCNPNLDTAKIGPAAPLINHDNPAIFRTVTMDKYLKEFFSRKLTFRTYLEHMRINKF